MQVCLSFRKSELPPVSDLIGHGSCQWSSQPLEPWHLGDLLSCDILLYVVLRCCMLCCVVLCWCSGWCCEAVQGPGVPTGWL